MTACGAVGALMVGGKVVGQLRCEIPLGIFEHDGPHAVTLEWTPESEPPDLDLFDPDESFDAVVEP